MCEKESLDVKDKIPHVLPLKLRLGPLGSEAFSIFCELESLSLWLAIWDHFQVELIQIEFSECISDVFDILA